MSHCLNAFAVGGRKYIFLVRGGLFLFASPARRTRDAANLVSHTGGDAFK